MATRPSVTYRLKFTKRDAADVREMGEMGVSSHHQPAQPASRQSWEWRQGKRLVALAERMEAELKKAPPA